MKTITVGIPRALLYHTYGKLWTFFFDELNIKYIISPKSNKKILESGINYTSDEACLSLKLFMGHVDYLKNKCDYVLIPRIYKLKKNEVVCTNFNALYDITRNSFTELNILNYNLDYKKRKTEYKEFVKLGSKLGKNSYECTKAYINAKKKAKEFNKEKKYNEKKSLIKDSKKVLIIGHPYNVYDNLIGSEIENILKNEKINILINPESKCKNLYKKIMPTLYFTYHKKLISSIMSYKNKVNGIILLSTFPCGTDSLIFDMLKRKVKDLPIIQIVFDDYMSNTGLITRIESFIDIIKENYNE